MSQKLIQVVSELLAFQKGVRKCQIELINTHTVAITVADPGTSQTDTITIDGTPYAFVSDATPTKQEISNGLIALLEAGSQGLRVSQGATPDYDVIIDTPWAAEVSENLALIATIGDNLVNDGAPCYLVAIVPGEINTGTYTIKDGATVEFVFGNGVLQAGVAMALYAVRFEDLRISLSEDDTALVLYIPEV
jgi:hypothetical protein